MNFTVLCLSAKSVSMNVLISFHMWWTIHLVGTSNQSMKVFSARSHFSADLQSFLPRKILAK